MGYKTCIDERLRTKKFLVQVQCAQISSRMTKDLSERINWIVKV